MRDQLLGRKARGELGISVAHKITCDELIEDLWEHAIANYKPSTLQAMKPVIDANLRPFFGRIAAAALTTDKLKEYRKKRRRKVDLRPPAIASCRC